LLPSSSAHSFDGKALAELYAEIAYIADRSALQFLHGRNPMGAIRSYRDLEVWRDSMALAVECYGATGTFPKFELYGGLASQVRRAATSVPANIAEGHARPTNAFRNHVSIALGSCAELATLLELSVRVGHLNDAVERTLGERLSKLGRQLHALRSSLGQ
jgi:four helix bundle protein